MNARTTPTPVFLLSQPRAGSTLLQRLLVKHPEIASAPEPWLLLPLLAFEREGLEVSAYSSESARLAMGEFIDGLSGGRGAWSRQINDYALGLYAGYCTRGESLFLDKTPRYALIADALAEHFPSARYLYLRRHPLQVLASVIETFGQGRLRQLFRYHIDLYETPTRLAEALPRLGDRLHVLDYEQLILAPRQTLDGVFRFLGVEPLPEEEIASPGGSIGGSMGDRTGVARYRDISREPLDRWRTTLSGRVRRSLCRSLLASTAEEAWRTLGFERSDLRRDADSLEGFRGISGESVDAIDLIRSEARRLSNAHLTLSPSYAGVRGRYLT